MENLMEKCAKVELNDKTAPSPVKKSFCRRAPTTATVVPTTAFSTGAPEHHIRHTGHVQACLTDVIVLLQSTSLY